MHCWKLTCANRCWSANTTMYYPQVLVGPLLNRTETCLQRYVLKVLGPKHTRIYWGAPILRFVA